MIESEKHNIRSLALFAEMDDKWFAALMRGAYVQNFPPQVNLITEGDSSDFLHIVLSGAVDLFSVWNGRETSLATVRPISTFILAASIKNAPYLMSARTMVKSRIVMVPSEDVRAAFGEDAQFARAIVTELASCYRYMVRSSKNLKLRTSLERLANYLLSLQLGANGAHEFDLDTEKRRLASLLGMTPENLSRAFKGLKAYGVSVKGSRVVIKDQASLEAFARRHPLIDS